MSYFANRLSFVLSEAMSQGDAEAIIAKRIANDKELEEMVKEVPGLKEALIETLVTNDPSHVEKCLADYESKTGKSTGRAKKALGSMLKNAIGKTSRGGIRGMLAAPFNVLMQKGYEGTSVS